MPASLSVHTSATCSPRQQNTPAEMRATPILQGPQLTMRITKTRLQCVLCNWYAATEGILQVAKMRHLLGIDMLEVPQSKPSHKVSDTFSSQALPCLPTQLMWQGAHNSLDTSAAKEAHILHSDPFCKAQSSTTAPRVPHCCPSAPQPTHEGDEAYTCSSTAPVVHTTEQNKHLRGCSLLQQQPPCMACDRCCTLVEQRTQQGQARPVAPALMHKGVMYAGGTRSQGAPTSHSTCPPKKVESPDGQHGVQQCSSRISNYCSQGSSLNAKTAPPWPLPAALVRADLLPVHSVLPRARRGHEAAQNTAFRKPQQHPIITANLGITVIARHQQGSKRQDQQQIKHTVTAGNRLPQHKATLSRVQNGGAVLRGHQHIGGHCRAPAAAGQGDTGCTRQAAWASCATRSTPCPWPTCCPTRPVTAV